MEEEHFAKLFLEWLQCHDDRDAQELAGVIDRPDMAIRTRGKTIAVELSQIPSSYIIRQLHRHMPAPVYVEGQITGHLVVYPFEPHRWVHEVVKTKEEKADAYKRAVSADEIWLVLHCHSMTNDWPLSGPSKLNTREAEALLMRFGLKTQRNKFKRVFFVYSDGAVVELTGQPMPQVVSLPVGSGYPALTAHQFSFSFAVPLPGLGVRNFQFEEIGFDKLLIAPQDDWMAGTTPEIQEPVFKGRATVSSERAEWEIWRDGNSILKQSMDASAHIGQTRYLHFLVNWGIQKTTFNAQF